MAFPNGSGGYQIGDGNLGEPLFFTQGAPTALTAAATATAAQLVNGLFTFDGTAGNLTLPTVALLEAAYPSIGEKVDSAFDFFVTNFDAAEALGPSTAFRNGNALGGETRRGHNLKGY